MCTEFCIFCGVKENLENHHVLPKSEGGTDEDFNLVTCCSLCHGKLHDLKRKPNHGELVKQGLQRAKERGVKLGSPQNLTKEVRDKGRSIANEKSKNRATELASKIAPSILKMRLEGYTLRGVAAKLNEDKIPTVSGVGSWNASTVRRVINYV